MSSLNRQLSIINSQISIRPRIKICCICSVEESRIAIRAGADALGLVSQMPSGPGIISEELISEIVKTIPPSIGSFLLTSLQDVDAIIEQQKRTRVNTIQLCDRLAHSGHAVLKQALPRISIVQVIHVTGEESFDEAADVAPHVNAILLDSGNQNLKIKELGGTGRKHNWEISKKIVEEVRVPIFLAGGLRPDNVAEAIATVQPFGLDVCSGVRTNGKLDEEKLLQFVSHARGG